MAEDFRAKVTAELDTAEAESKLNAFLNEKRKLKIDVEVNQDSAKKMASSIEKGIKDTKIDTSGISKQLAGSFNITDKNVISKLQSQMDKMISSLGKTWNGKDFDFGKASGFYSGMDSMVNTVMKNAKIVEGATGSYDAFFNYFKDKKIYVSDELKKAMGEDTYKELLQNNIGKIVRDASKGISIDSLWGEMSSLFPEHFSDNITTDQVDQIVHAFDVLHQAKAGVDSSVVDAYAAEEKQSSGKVTWDNETGAVDAFAAQVHRSSGLVSWGNETSRVKTHFTATGTVNWTNTTPPTKGAGGANGTAHASGTAHAAGSAQYNHLSGHAQASGNWATKTGGTTLVGELGREIVVNPATGTWNTVGDNGAEFVNIPAGSIVFNHLQTEALLDRGFINSRGLAQASGSAMVRGGIPVKQASIASKHTTYSGSKSPSNTDKAVAQAAKDSSSAAKSVTDAAEKVESWEDPWKNAVDWFERFTTKYNNSIDLNEAKAENYSSYENKNKYLDKLKCVCTEGCNKKLQDREQYSQE